MAFVDSVMLAVQLNVTLVLPLFYKHYEYLAVSQEQENEFWTQVLPVVHQDVFLIENIHALTDNLRFITPNP